MDKIFVEVKKQHSSDQGNYLKEMMSQTVGGFITLFIIHLDACLELNN